MKKGHTTHNLGKVLTSIGIFVFVLSGTIITLINLKSKDAISSQTQFEQTAASNAAGASNKKDDLKPDNLAGAIENLNNNVYSYSFDLENRTANIDGKEVALNELLQISSTTLDQLLSTGAFQTEVLGKLVGDDIKQDGKTIAVKNGFSTKTLIVEVTNSAELEKYQASDVKKLANDSYALKFDSPNEVEYAYELAKQDSTVSSVITDIKLKLNQVTEPFDSSWGGEMTGMNPYAKWLSKFGDTSHDVIVAVIDSGIDASHEAFVGNNEMSRLVKPIQEDNSIKFVTIDDPNYLNVSLPDNYCLSFTGDEELGNFECSDNNNDPIGHGTAVASAITESTPDNVKVLPIKIVGDDGDISLANVCEAINTYSPFVDIINLSLGANLTSSSEIIAADLACFPAYNQIGFDIMLPDDDDDDDNTRNVPFIIAAAGNESANSAVSEYDFWRGLGSCVIDGVLRTPCTSFPAGSDYVVAVSSVTRAPVNNTDKIIYGFSSNFSNYGSAIKFAMPGGYVRLATLSSESCANHCYDTVNGTSFSAPALAAAAALVKTAHPDFGQSELLDELIDLASTEKTQILTVAEATGEATMIGSQSYLTGLSYRENDIPSHDPEYFGYGVVDFNEKYDFSSPKMYISADELNWYAENTEGEWSVFDSNSTLAWTNADEVELTLNAYDGYYTNSEEYLRPEFAPIHGYGFGSILYENTVEFRKHVSEAEFFPYAYSSINKTATVSKNGTYYFWLSECRFEEGCVSNTGGSRTNLTKLAINIDHFDRLAPTISELTSGEVAPDLIEILISATDANATITDGKSGLSSLELCFKKSSDTDYSLSNCQNITLAQNSDLNNSAYRFANLEASTDYNFRAIIVDAAGNRSEAKLLNVSTNEALPTEITLTNLDVTLAPNSHVYSGEPIVPVITKISGLNNTSEIVLCENASGCPQNGNDYILEFSDNINASNVAKITIKAKADSLYHFNNTTKNFTILKRELTAAMLTLEYPNAVAYTGTEVRPAVHVFWHNIEIPVSEYTVSYRDNIEVGNSAKIIISDSGSGNYLLPSSLEATFSIVRSAIQAINPNNYGGARIAHEDAELLDLIGFTSEQRAQMDAGNSVSIGLSMRDTSNELDDSTRNLFTTYLSEHDLANAVHSLKFFDLGLKLTENWSGNTSEITATRVPIRIAVTLSDEMLNLDSTVSREYKVVRLHGDVISLLDATFNDNGILSFETDRFSTYAILYVDTVTVAPTPGEIITPTDPTDLTEESGPSLPVPDAGATEIAVENAVVKAPDTGTYTNDTENGSVLNVILLCLAFMIIVAAGGAALYAYKNLWNS